MDLKGINLDEIRAELAELSEDEIEQQLLEIHTKRRVQSKKATRDPEKMKAARMRRMARIAVMQELAGPAKWSVIKKKADARAEAILSGEDPDEAEAEVEAELETF